MIYYKRYSRQSKTRERRNIENWKKKIFKTCLSELLFYFLIFYLTGCASLDLDKPKLVVVLVVDQMRPDLLTRFNKLYEGGFKWLIDNGIWYSNTHHEHSYTATGPGHTAIGYGQYPGKVGVIGNSFYDRELGKKVNVWRIQRLGLLAPKKGKQDPHLDIILKD